MRSMAASTVSAAVTAPPRTNPARPVPSRAMYSSGRIHGPLLESTHSGNRQHQAGNESGIAAHTDADMPRHGTAAAVYQAVREANQVAARAGRIGGRGKEFARRARVQNQSAHQHQYQGSTKREPDPAFAAPVHGKRQQQTADAKGAEHQGAKRRRCTEEHPCRIGDHRRHIVETNAVLERAQGHREGVDEEPTGENTEQRNETGRVYFSITGHSHLNYLCQSLCSASASPAASNAAPSMRSSTAFKV